jgi:hypothetical protein
LLLSPNLKSLSQSSEWVAFAREFEVLVYVTSV